jgi:branched-chain amino acid transport system substrate-binding protein
MGTFIQAPNLRKLEVMMKRNGLRLAALLMSILMVGGLTITTHCAAGDTIRLGFIADASGIAAQIYQAQKNAIDLFMEEANASGGLLGKQWELVVRDAELKPERGVSLARDLILNEKCDFLTSGTSSAVALAVTKVAREFKKIIYFHTSNAEALTTTDFQPYMFQVVPNTGIEARGIAMFLSQRPYQRYSSIAPDYAYGRSQWEIFKAELSKRNPGAEIQEPVWTKVGETDYSPYIPVLIVKNPEIIFSSLWGGSLSSFIKQASPSRLFNKAIITSQFDLTLLKSIGMDMPEGLLGYSRCPFYAINTREMKAFVEKYRSKYQEWPPEWACTAYDGLVALTEAIKKAKSTDSDQVVKALEGMPFRSLHGMRYIRAEDHMADVGIYVGYTVKDPRFKDFLIMKDVTQVPADMVWLPVPEVKKLQSSQK